MNLHLPMSKLMLIITHHLHMASMCFMHTIVLQEVKCGWSAPTWISTDIPTRPLKWAQHLSVCFQSPRTSPDLHDLLKMIVNSLTMTELLCTFLINNSLRPSATPKIQALNLRQAVNNFLWRCVCSAASVPNKRGSPSWYRLSIKVH